MPLPLLSFFVGTSLSTIIFRSLALLGIGVITYTGSQELIQQATQLIDHSLDSFPSELRPLLGVMNVDRYLSMVISAWSIAISIKLTTRIGIRK